MFPPVSLLVLLSNVAMVVNGVAAAAPWRFNLEKALEPPIGSSPSSLPASMCLSTTTAEGPRNRFMTYQSFTHSDLIVMATDRNRDKVAELAVDPNVEIAWYFPSEGMQYRIRGIAAPIGLEGEFSHAKDVLKLDNEEADYAFWEEEREWIFKRLGARSSSYDHPPPDGSEIPEGTDVSRFNFVLLAVQPERVEVFDLRLNKKRIHVRVSGEWETEPGVEPVVAYYPPKEEL